MADVGYSLFTKNEIRDLFNEKFDNIFKEIDRIEIDELKNTSIEELCEYFQEKYEINPLRVEEVMKDTERREENGKRFGKDFSDGILMIFRIPFSGDEILFSCKPMSKDFPNSVRAEISFGVICLMYIRKRSSNFLEQMKSDMERELSKIKTILDSIETDVKEFNNTIKIEIENRIRKRLNNFEEDKKEMERLGYPLEKRENAPQTYILPKKQKKLSFPKASKNSNKSNIEYSLEMEDYENVLDIIKNMSLVMERSPKVFSNLDENSIRIHFLVQLNGQYKGSATGETFNADGKTDILVRKDGNNVFIAECKFWNGQEKLTRAVNQLLKYTTWRDTKTALLVFNKKKNFSSVLDKIQTTIKEHPNFVEEEYLEDETDFRFKLHHNDDKSKLIYLTVLAFDIPKIINEKTEN